MFTSHWPRWNAFSATVHKDQNPMPWPWHPSPCHVIFPRWSEKGREERRKEDFPSKNPSFLQLLFHPDPIRSTFPPPDSPHKALDFPSILADLSRRSARSDAFSSPDLFPALSPTSRYINLRYFFSFNGRRSVLFRKISVLNR